MKKLTPSDPETHSPDITSENISKLRELFPELITEGAEGVSVNLDVLKQLVGDRTVTDVQEKYGLNWHGKRQARQIALTPSTGTLRPCPEDSVDWDTTQNLFLEGDNLEILKLLQKPYAGKVKLMYWDPPYNTGSDFVYPDNYQDNIKNYLEITGQVGEGGVKLSSNSEASGRYHTDWLNMIYPRLKLARNLLKDDGVLMISIDENEVSNLFSLCNEVFGEENFVECLVYDKKAAPKGVPPVNMIVGVHEYVLCYQRSDKFKFLGTLRSKEDFSNPDNDPRGDWRNTNLRSTTKSSSEAFEIKDPDTGLVYKDTWAFSPSEIENLINERRLIFPKKLDGQVRQKEFFNEFGSPYIPIKSSLGLYDAQGNTEKLVSLMGDKFFQNPKHIELMQKLISAVTKDNDIILDVFSGSGTTGHAVMLQNGADCGSRRFILAQLPEPLDPDTKEQKTAADFCDKLKKPRTIAELTKERLRRAGKKIKEENPLFKGDTGFRVFKLASTNIREWEPDRENLEGSLESSVDHLKTDRTEQDILFELLLKLGLDLTVRIETQKLGTHELHAIGAGALFVCLSKGIPKGDVEKLAEGIITWHKKLNPAGETTIVFRDSAFADDVAKTNLTAILDQAGLSNVRSL